MAEGENKKIDIDIDTEELKNQTKDTVKQVKETIKDVDFKNDAKEATGLVKEMFVNPFEAVKRVANEKENAFKKSIVIMIIFIAANIIWQVISLMKYSSVFRIGNNVMKLVSSALHPVFYIVVPAILILIMNKNNKKSLTVIISTLVTAAVPAIIVDIIDILEILVSAVTVVSSPISTGLSAISIVLTYIGIKELFAEEDDGKAIKTFAIIKIVAAFVFYLLTSAGIY